MWDERRDEVKGMGKNVLELQNLAADLGPILALLKLRSLF